MRWKRILLIVSLLLVTLSAAHAQRPDAPPYAQHGEYAVGTRDFVIEDADRPLEVTVWYPALNPDELEETVRYGKGLVQLDGHALLDADPVTADAPFPLVVFSHGSGGTRFQSLFLVEHLASQGFVVIAPDHPGNTVLEMVMDSEAFAANIITNFALRPLDVLRVIEFADNLNTESPLSGVIDMENIAIAGHSFGGYTALAVAGGQLDFSGLEAFCTDSSQEDGGHFCNLLEQRAAIAELRGLENIPDGEFPPTSDPRVKAIILMAPVGATSYSLSSLQGITASSLVIVGTADTTAPPEREGAVIYEMLGSQPKALALFENAGHFIFLEACPELAISMGLFDSCSDKVWDLDRAHDLVNQLSTAFLLMTLKGDQEAAQSLTSEAVDFVGIDYSFVGN